MKGQVLVEHRVSGAALFFMANGETILSPLVLPDDFSKLTGSIKGHVGDERWKAWESLVADVNSNLTAAVSLWKEIGDRVATAGREVGLFATTNPMEPFPDTYWPELFMGSIWREPQYYDEKKAHSWEKVEIVEDQFFLSTGHMSEQIPTWIFDRSPMVKSQSKQSVEAMKKAWESEATRADPGLRKLMAERDRIDGSSREFQALLNNLQSEYAKTSRLSGACSICKPWLDELGTAQDLSSSGATGGQTAPPSGVADLPHRKA
ncbi:MAG: hypothetical protein OK456_03190 [Thaumarchaeota archaeon]|nr:hypothetical protein [Nitrososphaerota archaeon]